MSQNFSEAEHLERKVCFVVMGFGKKTDYESGRTLDLDATYEVIIKPVAEDLRLRCIRSDEIMHSGTIDTAMYEMLLRSDLVIADISTGNVNAVYELGVRHALRPFSTIVMKEADGRLYFDLSHTNTFEYRHLGEDIGAREAERARRDLKALIIEVLETQKTDSPVYTYLPKLQQPRLSEAEFAELLDETEAAQEYLSNLIQAGEEAMKSSQFEAAIASYKAAANLRPGEPYVIQQLALATYKSKKPTPLGALLDGLKVIHSLKPDSSNDPETLGITGAIYKRIWLETKDPSALDSAIRMYSRGYEIRRDYYNGENLASCYQYRANLQENVLEVIYDHMSAQKVRQSLVAILDEMIEMPSFEERTDRKWVFATMANCLFALGDQNRAEEYEALFMAESPADWECQTYFEGKALVHGN